VLMLKNHGLAMAFGGLAQAVFVTVKEKIK
jgi:hypothetical protein